MNNMSLTALICLVCFFFTIDGVNGRSNSSELDMAALEDWDIVVAADAIESEVYAAEELQHFYQLISGVKLPVKRSADRPDRHIFVGEGRAMQDSDIGFSVDQFGAEDLRIVVRGENIAIAGGRPRGTLYGVYTFLEDYLGVRFLTVDHTHVPSVGSRRPIGAVDRVYSPPLNYRWSFYEANRYNPEFAARLRNNTLPGSHKMTWRYPGIPKLGGKTDVAVANHSFRYLIPPKTYAEDHPDYYALFRGERLASLRPGAETSYNFTGGFVYGMQPCLTHPDVLKIVTKNLIDEAKAHPELLNYSVSQDDGGAFCQCPTCAPIVEKEGFSGYLLQFVNKVADALEKECPGKMVATEAYSDTLAPPRSIRPRKNVQVWFSTINMCGIHDLDDPTCAEPKKYIKNTTYSTFLKQWNAMCDNLYVWEYVANFEYTNYQLPVPNFESIERRFRFLTDHGVKGMFVQATASSHGNEFEDLRNYVVSNLLWDPSRSSRKLVKEFLDLHLGPAGEPIRTWINTLSEASKAGGTHCRLVGATWEELGLDHALAVQGIETFEKAMALAPNDAIKARVEKMSICAYRAMLEPIWYVRYTETNVPWEMKEHHATHFDTTDELKTTTRPYARRFFELCDKYGAHRTGEGDARSIAAARDRLNKVLDGF